MQSRNDYHFEQKGFYSSWDSSSFPVRNLNLTIFSYLKLKPGISFDKYHITFNS